MLAISARVLTFAGIDSTLCPTRTAQLNCVSVSGKVTGVLVCLIVFAVVVTLFSLVCQVKIVTKAGYSGWYVLTAFVPILGTVMFLIFAFGKWPIQKRLEAAERGWGGGYNPPPFAGMPGPGGGGGSPVGRPTASLVQEPGTAAVGAMALGVQPGGGSSVIYCSWCGKERAIDAHAIHYCGSMERPAVYCMRCGAPFDGAGVGAGDGDGAPNCVSCGTPHATVSR